jgi:hypothetical protein
MSRDDLKEVKKVRNRQVKIERKNPLVLKRVVVSDTLNLCKGKKQHQEKREKEFTREKK